MSLFNWFSRKPAPIVPPKGTGQSRPQVHSSSRSASRKKPVADEQPQPSLPQASQAEQRKNERLHRREQLYQIVRDVMPRAGLLSSAYKFKVLSLDQRGRQFMVMMDLAVDNGSEPAQWSQIETMIIHSAKTRNNIDVTAVYWRLLDLAAMEQARQAANGEITHPMPLQVARPMPHHDPLDEEEVAAFKRALAAGIAPPVVAVRQTGNNYTLLTGYEDTEVAETDEPTPALSGTQYGELR